MEKTSIISIRVYENEKRMLLEESRKNNMTINSLGRQIISKHIEWHRYSKDLGYTCITKNLMKTLLTNNNETTNHISTDGYNTLKNTISMMYGEINISNLLTVFDIWLSASNISFRHFTDFNTEKYAINHNMGKSFSMYLNSSLNSILNELEYTIINNKIDENCTTFEISKGIII